MADERGRSSNTESDKRKLVLTSDSDWSVDSAFSPPAKKYKLPTPPVCVFDGKSFSTNGTATSESNCTVRGSSTCYWGPAQTNRLNFKQPMYVAPCFEYSGKQNILRFLFEELEGPDDRELSGPEIVTTTVKEKLLEVCTAGSPVEKYIREVFTDLKKSGFSFGGRSLLNRSEEQISQIETYLENKIKQDRQSKKYDIPEMLFGEIKVFLLLVFWLCCIDKKPERGLDKLIKSMMQIIQIQDDPYIDWFQIRDCTTSKMNFDICGASMTSTPNILWEIANAGSMFSNKFIPVIMSENKGSYSEGENHSKQTTHHPHRKKTSYHRKLPQVIGQCISVADKSMFETKDYKIVYHVSLMSTDKLVITRTHVAKSTLKVIKDGCPIPDQNELDPSYVFEYPIHITNNVQELTVCLYTSLQIFEKLAYKLLCEKPGTEGEKTSLEVFKTN